MSVRFKKTISVLLMSCLTASLLAGCNISFGKATKQQEVVERYMGACLEFDYRQIASCIEDKDDAFQDLQLESPQREIVELVLSKAEFEVVEVENDRVLVNLTVPDIDKALRRECIPALEVEDLGDILDDSGKTIEEEFEFDLVKVDKEWLIDPDSTEEFAEFVSEIGLEVAPQIGLGTKAIAFFDTVMTYLAQGNVDAAYDLLYRYGNAGSSSGSGATYSPELDALIDEYYGAIFSRVEYEAEVVSCDDSCITLEITGTRAALYDAASAAACENEELSLPFVKRVIMLYMAFEGSGYSEYGDVLADYLIAYTTFDIACLEFADTESFTVQVDIEIQPNGDLTMQEDVLSDVMGYNDVPVFADEFYYAALDELLADGEITQAVYDDLVEEGPDYIRY